MNLNSPINLNGFTKTVLVSVLVITITGKVQYVVIFYLLTFLTISTLLPHPPPSPPSSPPPSSLPSSSSPPSSSPPSYTGLFSMHTTWRQDLPCIWLVFMQALVLAMLAFTCGMFEPLCAASCNYHHFTRRASSSCDHHMTALCTFCLHLCGRCHMILCALYCALPSHGMSYPISGLVKKFCADGYNPNKPLMVRTHLHSSCPLFAFLCDSLVASVFCHLNWCLQMSANGCYFPTV